MADTASDTETALAAIIANTIRRALAEHTDERLAALEQRVSAVEADLAATRRELEDLRSASAR